MVEGTKDKVVQYKTSTGHLRYVLTYFIQEFRKDVMIDLGSHNQRNAGT